MRAARGRCPSSAHHCSAQHFPSLPLTSQAKMRSVSCRALGVYMCACPVSRLRETDTQCCAGLEMPTSKYCRCADDCGHEATCCKRLNAAGQGQKRALNNDTHCGGCQGLPPRNRQKTNAAAAGGGGGGGEGGGGGPVQLVLPPQALQALDAIGGVQRGMRCARAAGGRSGSSRTPRSRACTWHVF